ncbi:hypothetical protein KJ910_02815 [Patescibacteria group bacterium]|nr:hypothetical protein [Patescibacteria group bacterium]
MDEVISFIDERFSRGDLLGVSINLYPVGKRLIDMCGWMDIPTRPSVEPQRLTYFDLHDIADDLKYPVVNKSITCLIVN